MDDEFDLNKINNIRLKITKYLNEYKELYPNENMNPKQHFLIHYPSAILLYGPPKFYSTMRFESKHSYFKNVHHATHNHINLLYSLAARHQNLQVYHLLSPDYFVDLERGSRQFINATSFEFITIILNINLKINEFDIYNWIIKKGIKYQINDVVASNKQQNIITFSVIQSIIIVKNKITFQIIDLKTVEYIDFMTAFKLKEMESMPKFLAFENLKSPWPMDLYNYDTTFKLVSPKYPIN